MNIDRLGRIDLAEVKYVETDKGARIVAGDVLFNNTNSPVLIGKTAYFDRSGEWAFSNHMTRLRPPTGLDAKFLATQLHFFWSRGYFQELASHHVNQASVSSKTLVRAVSIALPPLAEQRRIVAAIEEHFSRLDAAEESLRRGRTRFGALTLAALGKAIEGDWPIKGLGEVCEIVSGSTPRTTVREYWGGDIPWITPDDLSGYAEKTIARGARSLTPAGYESCSTHLVPAGTALYTSRAPIGYVAIAAQPVCTNQGFKSFVPSSALDSDFLYWFLRFSTPRIRKLGSGTTFPELSKTTAREIPIPVPPLADQRRIVAEVERRLSLVDALAAATTAALKRSTALRRSILERAFTGQLVPQDPRDEPASALLERIKVERETQVKLGKSHGSVVKPTSDS